MTALTGAELRFVTTPGTVVLAGVLVAALAATCLAAWWRSGLARGQGLLELLRFAIGCLVALLLNQPEWVETIRSSARPAVAVLVDASASMETRDVPPAAGTPGADRTRREAAAPLAESAFWQPLAARFDVVVEPFAAAPEAAGTDLAAPLAAARQRFANLRAVVLVSDGDWNRGPPPLAAAEGLRSAGVPVMVVPIGSTTRRPDLELASLECPTVGVAGKPVRVPFTIDSSLPSERSVTVTLETSTGDTVSREVRVPALGSATDSLYWTPRDVGDATVTVGFAAQPGELNPANNARSAPITIRRERLRVLIVESVPRWEYRYLRNALSRDPGIDVSCLLFQPGLSRPGGGTRDAIDAFPERLDELAVYDVVFLGDVGVAPGELTAEQCRLLKGLVEFQASGLVFLPGWRGAQASFVGTELEDLCPVVIDQARPEGSSTPAPRRLVLTEAGSRSLLTKLADDPAGNLAVWESLPGVQWFGPVLRAKAGSEVLAVHEEAGNEFGRIPLLVTRTYGAGKVLYMATDGAWRWRKGVEDRYHYRFWGQVVRWMAYRRNMAKGERMSLSFVPEQPLLGQSLAFDARVTQPGGEPLSRGDVAARITAPSGRIDTVRFAPPAGDGAWGVFAADYVPREPGRHEIELACRDTGDRLTTSVFVQGQPAEGIGRAARPQVLAEIAQVTGGRLATPEEAPALLEALGGLAEPPPIQRPRRLWCHPAVAVSVVGLLGLFWAARKRQGLI